MGKGGWSTVEKHCIQLAMGLKFRYLIVSEAKAGLRPATQIRVSGCSGMALVHSRGTSCVAPRRPPRITSCDSFGGQNRYEPGPNILKYS